MTNSEVQTPCMESILEFDGCRMEHKHKLVALVNVQMPLGQTTGCPRVNRAKKFMCSPRNTGKINFSLWLTRGVSQGFPDFQKVYVFKVYVPFSCPRNEHWNRLPFPTLRHTPLLMMDLI